MKRTHVFLPEQLLKELRVRSALTGLSVAELIRTAVIEFLGKTTAARRVSEK